MAVIDELKILVTAEVAKAISDLDKTEKQTKKTSSAFATMRDAMQGPVAAGKAVIQVFQQIKAVSDKMEAEFAQSEQAAAILNSTLLATGGAAGLTAEDIQDLAAEFQRTTKYEGDMVIGMENVLLGFKNIKGDNFKEASLQILNMATVMNMDLTSAAQAVGKALDDPIKGVDSLSRQGFKFSDQQKALMKTLVESGKIEEAQGIILEELATTYGGAAVAAGDTASAVKVKLGNAIGDVNEEIGRSISNNLKPWRLMWLDLAVAIGASAKAQNDFREAMAKDKSGIATDKDRLVIAKELLSRMQEQHEAFIATEGLAGQFNAEEIEAQKTIIKNLEKEISKRDGLRTAAQKAADEAAENAAKQEAAQGALNKKYQESRSLVVSTLDSQKTKYDEILDQIEILQATPWATGKLEEDRQAALAALEQELENMLEPMDEAEKKSKDIAVSVGEIRKQVDMVSSAWGEWTLKIGNTEMLLSDVGIVASSAWSMAGDAFSAYSDLVANGYDKEISALEKKMEAMKKAGQDTTAIEAQILAKKNELAEKEFNAKKLTALAEIAINTAIEISKVLAIPGAPLVIGGLGAVQAAMVLAQEYVPMAEGGYGTVTKPTLFLAGEAGAEDYAFGPKRKGGLSGGGGTTIIQNISGSIWSTKSLESMAVSAQAKASRGF